MTKRRQPVLRAARARKYQIDIDTLRSLLVRSERRLGLALDEITRCHQVLDGVTGHRVAEEE